MVTQAYNGEATPFGPTALLLSMWKASTELAGHEQQGASSFTFYRATNELTPCRRRTDAHAFFLAALNQLHSQSANDDTKHMHCPCIARKNTVPYASPRRTYASVVDRAFAGTLLSTVTCANCGNQTKTEDPILDISLGLQTSAGSTSKALTLGECFRR